MLEISLQKQIIKWLKDHKVLHWRMQAYPNLFGMPDIVALVNGYFVGLELKRPDKKGRTSGLQEKKIKTINSNGGKAYIVDSFVQFVSIMNNLGVK